MEKPFVFEDHIVRFVHPKIAERQEKRSLISAMLSARLAEWYAKRNLYPLEAQQVEDERHYDLARKAFEDMLAQGRVNIEHKVFANNHHKLILTGTDIETFTIRENPYHHRSEDGKEKISVLPVYIGNSENKITFYDYPRPDNPLTKFSRVTLDYTFSTEISLGGESSSDGQVFTDNPDERVRWDINRSIGLFYGKPGRVALRLNDATFNELNRAVLGTWIFKNVNRDKLNMWGIIRTKGGCVYQGNFDVTGSFPFYIDEDRDGDRAKNPEPVLAGKG